MTVSAAVLLLLALCVAACETGTEEPTSILIANATVYDGTGADGTVAAVRIDGSRIAAFGDLSALDDELVIDATGLVLAPGFIDTHSHHDEDIVEMPHMPGVLSQGVTTIVRGADGDSGAYESVAAFNESLNASPVSVNVASYSAHNSIRQRILGDDHRRHATDEEIKIMAGLIDADMQAGAIGLSTGLEYEPGIFASTEEIIALAKTAAARGGRYMSHLRDEDDRFVEAVHEIIRVGSEAGLPVHISHIKLADRLAWGTSDKILALLDDARADGVAVTADIYPYERWASNLAVLFPERDYDNRASAEFTFERTAAADDILLVEYPPNTAFNGLTVAQIAKIVERDEVTTLLELSKVAEAHRKETGEDASIIAKSMNNEDIAAFMRWPHLNICSDGWHGGHPRGYGSFPRVLRLFTREMGTLAMPNAIFKMTGNAADNMGFKDRGRIRVGNYADLVLFDPDTVADHATMRDPTAVSTGIERVWVNGVLAFHKGQPTNRRAGRIIRRDE